MHISLLLFSVGLCVYLWNLNSTVAIPVMSIAGIFWHFISGRASPQVSWITSHIPQSYLRFYVQSTCGA
ncbi:hypothetical protein B0J17DRAFT_747455, partial [Rhizoctonia solani]